MKFVFKEGVGYYNGKYVPSSQLNVSVYDSTMMFGDMVFEFTRSFQQRPFRLREHLERLYASMEICRIDPQMTIDRMEEVTLEVIDKNIHLYPPEIDFQILHDVSRGILGTYRRLFDNGEGPCVIIDAYPLDIHQAQAAPLYDSGIHLIIPRQMSVPSRYIDPKIKNRSRIFYMLADQQAHDVRPDSWALLLGEDGLVTEGTGSNAFLVRDGVLYTPEPRNVLRGVSRQMVIDLARKLEIPCIERNLEPYDFVIADEAFLTSTRFCILPAVSVDGHRIGNGKPGDVTGRLLKAWSAEVGVDIVGQAKSYAEALT